MLMPLPTFTVTINPMEDNEITFVPDSPPADCADKPLPESAPANGNNAPADSVESSYSEELMRRSSIGSASSLMMDNRLLAVSQLSIR